MPGGLWFTVRAYLQDGADLLGDVFFGTDDRMAAELVLQLATLVPVDPAEHPRIVLWRAAVGDPVRPVLGQSVLPGRGFQAGRAQAQLHHDVRFAVLGVVAPQCGQRFLHASVTCK